MKSKFSGAPRRVSTRHHVQTWILVLAAIISPLNTWPSLFFPSAQAAGQTIVINELMWMGSSSSSADEWLELRNLTDQPVDLSNWQLTKKSGGVEVAMLTLPIGQFISANGYFLISNYADTNASSVLNIVPNVVMTDMALANSALHIKLYDAAHALIDTADDGVGNPLAGEFSSAGQVYDSMERNPVPGDGSLSENWHTASREVGFDDGKTELGTPGTNNSNGRPVADAGPDLTSVIGQAVNFDGSDSNDPEGQPLTYVWDFGDGVDGSGATPQHVYAAAGEYVATLAVNDGTDAASDTATVIVTSAPTAADSSPSGAPTTFPSQETNSTCRGLELSEIYPNPPGVDNGEFVELQNTGDEEINVEGCSVGTSAAKVYKLPKAMLSVDRYLLVTKTQSKLTLRNTDGVVRLLDVNGQELDRVTYDTAKEGASYAVISQRWQWTGRPTPGQKNVLVAVTAIKTSTAKAKITSAKKTIAKEKAPAASVTIHDIQELDSGDRIVVRGVITSEVGALGATLTTLQSADGAVTLTIPNGSVPLVVGQEVEVTGTVRLYQGRRRVAVETDGLKLLSTVTVEPLMMATDDIGGDQGDQLVHVRGTVALASGSHIDIDDGSGPVTIYIKSSTGIIRPKVKMGDTVDAIGIVNASTSGVRVLPRSQNDLQVERVLGASTTTTTPVALPTSSPRQTMWYWMFVGVGVLAVAAKPVWKKWKKKS